MKQFIQHLVFLLLFSQGLMAQHDLCVGYHWTDARGKQHLDSIGQRIQSAEDWMLRAHEIRQHLLLASGAIDPASDRPVPQVKVGRVHEMEGYRVINLAIEQSEGSWITGNLYEPTHHEGLKAVVLCPHGHWSDPSDYGRFREDMQRRCAVFCRMGAIVYAWDMVGYGDNRQAQHNDSLALRIQLNNSIRILDYLLSRKDVDSERVAVTGASGGATQTFLLTALDARVKVSVPVVQVSAHFFGGCVCESGLPIHKGVGFQTNNVEIAACAAPRPMLIISDGDDWTKNTPEIEFPFIQRIYALSGSGPLVENQHFGHEKHDYGFTKRQPVYRFFAKHLGLHWDEELVNESWFRMLGKDELSLSLRP